MKQLTVISSEAETRRPPHTSSKHLFHRLFRRRCELGACGMRLHRSGWSSLVLIAVGTLQFVSPFVPVEAEAAVPVTLERTIATGSNDAEERAGNGKIDLKSSDLELTTDGTNVQTVGLRFLNLTIPPGATITEAWVQFRVDEVSSGAASLTIAGQAADNAATFTTVSSNVSSRPRTAATVGWAPSSWPTVNLAGPNQRTPDLSAVIQQIVGRSGWVSGNALALVITGTGRRTADAFEDGGAPTLHLVYSSSASGTNQPPSVGAGLDQTIVLPAGASLDATVSDDGLPNPPASSTTNWSVTSGPGTVSFANANAVDTTATFSAAGTYVLRLTANDSALSAFDEVTVTVNPAVTNQPPSVGAGLDQTIVLPAGASLDATVSDDGLPNPPASSTTSWSVTSGPGTVSFANASAVDTTATFSAAGTYVLRLTANDSALSAFDEVTVTVSDTAQPVDEVHYTFTGPTSVAFDWRGGADDIQFGPTNEYGTEVIAQTPDPIPFSSAGPFWEAHLTALQPGTTYHYSIGGGLDHTFTTAPTGDCRFDVEGDIGSSDHNAAVTTTQAQIAGDGPDFVLAVGDLTYGNIHGASAVDMHFNDVMEWSRSAAYMPAWGNHEWDPTDDLSATTWAASRSRMAANPPARPLRQARTGAGSMAVASGSSRIPSRTCPEPGRTGRHRRRPSWPLPSQTPRFTSSRRSDIARLTRPGTTLAAPLSHPSSATSAGHTRNTC